MPEVGVSMVLADVTLFLTTTLTLADGTISKLAPVNVMVPAPLITFCVEIVDRVGLDAASL